MSAKDSVPAGKTSALSSSAAVAPIARRSNGQHTAVADLRAPSQLDVGRTCNSSRDTFRLIIIARNERAWLVWARDVSPCDCDFRGARWLPR